MHKVKKLVFVIQDLQTKEKETLAIVSGDIHLKDIKKPVSFQMLLSENKEFNRCINALVKQALSLHDKSNSTK